MSPLPDIVPDLCDAIVLQLHFLEHVPAFPQKIAATDDNSALREDMRALEPEEENAQPRTQRELDILGREVSFKGGRFRLLKGVAEGT